jgi:hypothetical protein
MRYQKIARRIDEGPARPAETAHPPTWLSASTGAAPPPSAWHWDPAQPEASVTERPPVSLGVDRPGRPGAWGPATDANMTARTCRAVHAATHAVMDGRATALSYEKTYNYHYSRN